jgi:tetratricopeptide (TPR) repeat protein
VTNLIRVVLVAALLWQGWNAWVMTRYESLFRAGVRAYTDAGVEEIVELFHEARELRDGDALLWAWIADASIYRFDYYSDGAEIDPEVGREALEEAWRSYTGSILRCPPYAWSWAGLSETATRMSQLRDQTGGVDIAALANRRAGIWDPLRAAGLGAGFVAVEVKPSGFHELDVLGDSYASAGDREKAAEFYALSARMLPAPSFHTWGEGDRLYGEEYQSILDALEDGIARAPEFERGMLHIEAGRFAMAQSDPTRALDYFRLAEKAPRTEYERGRALWEASAALEALGRYEEAILSVEAALATPFLPGGANQRLATLYDVVGRDEDACRAYRRTMTKGRPGAAWRIRAARSCEDAEQVDEAERILLGGLHDPTHHPVMARELVELYLRGQRLNTLHNTLDSWIQNHPEQEEFRRWKEAAPEPPL